MPSLEKRVEIANKFLSKEDNFSLSLWESSLKEAVNFTTVISYIETLYPENEVWYVFGKECYNFAYAFKHHGKCVYVKNSEEFNIDFMNHLENVHIAYSENYKNLSSTIVRNKPYLIRDDSEIVSIPYCDQVKVLLKELFNDVLGGIDVEFISPLKQIEQANKFLNEKNIISLDHYFKGSCNLEISRLFKISQGKEEFISMSNRLGSLDLKEQIKSIKPGKYFIIDDDIASGRTISEIKTLLKDNDIFICGEFSMLSLLGKINFYDIVDLRDFIFDMPHGGLQIIGNHGLYRIPYLYPFIDLEKRAKIPKNRLKEFSIRVLGINYLLFEKDERTIDSCYCFDYFIKELGFDRNLIIKDFLNILIEGIKNDLY